MDVLNQALELHRQLRTDFQRREALIAAREAEARRVLEEILQKCAADRAAIQQETDLLNSVEVVYRRFLDRQMSQAQDVDHSALVPTTPDTEPLDGGLDRLEGTIEVAGIVANEVAASADMPWAAHPYISDMASAITGLRRQRLTEQHSQALDG